MSRPTLVIASRNAGKIVEVRHILAGLDVDLVGLADVTDAPEVDETEDTFVGNAVLKARAAAAATGLPSLADDSGLEIDALDGAPGVRSARYSGLVGTRAEIDAANIAKVLAALSGMPPAWRRARFRAAVALVDPAGRMGGEEALVGDGTCEGEILDAPRGSGGFGYDPIFYLPELGRTLAEVDLATKSQLSHRGRALAALRPGLLAYFGVAPRGQSGYTEAGPRGPTGA